MLDIEVIATDVVDCAIKVYKTLGPGLLESAYQFCHAYELRKRGWGIETELKLPLLYEGQKIDVVYRIDTLINTISHRREQSCRISASCSRSTIIDLHETKRL